MLKGARLTAIFDSCHSATALDLPFVYDSYGQVRFLICHLYCFSIYSTQVRLLLVYISSFFNVFILQPKKQKYSRKTAGMDLLESGLKMTKVSGHQVDQVDTKLTLLTNSQ